MISGIICRFVNGPGGLLSAIQKVESVSVYEKLCEALLRCE